MFDSHRDLKFLRIFGQLDEPRTMKGKFGILTENCAVLGEDFLKWLP